MIRRRLIALSAVIALAACSHVPLGSILPLTRIKFGTTDIARARRRKAAGQPAAARRRRPEPPWPWPGQSRWAEQEKHNPIGRA